MGAIEEAIMELNEEYFDIKAIANQQKRKHNPKNKFIPNKKPI